MSTPGSPRSDSEETASEIAALLLPSLSTSYKLTQLPLEKQSTELASSNVENEELEGGIAEMEIVEISTNELEVSSTIQTSSNDIREVNSITETSQIVLPEIFKIPLPPPASAISLTGLPADIEHIIASGANQPDEAELVATSNYEKVVRDMKEKAGFGIVAAIDSTDNMEVSTVDTLKEIEQEMLDGGVPRNVADENISESKPDKDLLDMIIDVSSDKSDSEKSDSSDSDSESKPPIASTSKTNKKGKQPIKRGGKGKADSDDDISDDDVNTGSAPTTEHESVPIVELPKMERVPEGEEIIKFGTVANVIESVVVIKADTAGDWRVLDQGSLCCWEDKTVIGSIFETFGSVQSPFYTLRFPATALPAPEVFTVGKAVYYAPKLSSFIFTRDIRAIKGSDASNIWDEEVGAGEMEWSDDEQEQEYKKNAKNDRRARSASLAPGPKSRQGSRAPSVTPSTLPPMPSSLPARPLVSYSDADVYKPNERLFIGERPPSGREGRQMFERDDGGRLGGGGMGVEYDFDSDNDETGSISSTFEVDERYREIDEMARLERESAASRGRGGRGGRGGGGRGNDERGRGRGRGGARGSQPRNDFGRREEEPNSPGGRPVAGLPRRVSGPPPPPERRDEGPPRFGFGFDGQDPRGPPNGHYPPNRGPQYSPQQFNPGYNQAPPKQYQQQQYNPHHSSPYSNQPPNRYPPHLAQPPRQQPPPPALYSRAQPPPVPFNFNPMIPMGGFNPYHQQPVYTNQSRSFNSPSTPGSNQIPPQSNQFANGYATQQYSPGATGGTPNQFQQQQNVWRNQNQNSNN